MLLAWQFSHGWALTVAIEVECCWGFDWGLCCVLRAKIWRESDYWGEQRRSWCFNNASEFLYLPFLIWAILSKIRLLFNLIFKFGITPRIKNLVFMINGSQNMNEIGRNLEYTPIIIWNLLIATSIEQMCPKYEVPVFESKNLLSWTYYDLIYFSIFLDFPYCILESLS